MALTIARANIIRRYHYADYAFGQGVPRLTTLFIFTRARNRQFRTWQYMASTRTCPVRAFSYKSNHNEIVFVIRCKKAKKGYLFKTFRTWYFVNFQPVIFIELFHFYVMREGGSSRGTAWDMFLPDIILTDRGKYYIPWDTSLRAKSGV